MGVGDPPTQKNKKIKFKQIYIFIINMESLKQFNLLIIQDKFITKGKLENFKRYIERLDTMANINIYNGYLTLEDLSTFIKTHELEIESKSELLFWIKTLFHNLLKGLNKRIDMADDFLLIKHIITEYFRELKLEYTNNYKKTIEFVNSINLDELLILCEIPENICEEIV
jgi:hypothetical protein